MFNIKELFKKFFYFIEKIKTRYCDIDFKKIISLYKEYKLLKFKIQYLQLKRNILTKKFFINKTNEKKIIYFKKNINLIKIRISINKTLLKKLFNNINDIFLFIPNVPHVDVPIGINDNYNKVIYYWGDIKKYNFNIVDHIKFGKISGEINFDESIVTSGTNFSVMKNNVAKLYRSLSQFMMDLHTSNNNYCEIYVPYIVNSNSLYGTGQLPKFYNDLFHVTKGNSNNNKLFLIPTSEVPLVNLFKDKILNESDLPIKLVANTPCFRAETVSYGKKNRGLIRLHQFDKVELLQIVHPEKSNFILDDLTNDAEKILKKLKLSYRKVLLCTSSMNFSSCKTYDLEVWSPVDNSYLEVSSCSNTSNFQSRRLNICFKNFKKKKKDFVHILNGSGLAISRVLAIILESCQIKSGVVKIPKVLIKYMNGIKYIKCFK